MFPTKTIIALTINSILISIPMADAKVLRTDMAAFATPIHCIDTGFNMSTYLIVQRKFLQLTNNRAYPYPRFMREDADSTLSRTLHFGHLFTAIGDDIGQRCRVSNTPKTINEYDPNGCFPYREISKKFEDIENCLKDAFPTKPNGTWMNQEHVWYKFKFYKSSIAERILYPLVRYATSEYVRSDLGNDDRNEPNAKATLSDKLKDIFDESEVQEGAIEHVRKCIKKVQISRDGLKCYSTVLGGSGFNGQLVIEHSREGVHPKRQVSELCQVPSSCMREATTLLYQMQYAKFDKLYLKGLLKEIKTGQPRSWIEYNGQLKHDVCNLKHSALGITHCWNYTSCLRQMLRKKCNEDGKCCPNEAIHHICKRDIRDERCQVCKEQNPAISKAIGNTLRQIFVPFSYIY